MATWTMTAEERKVQNALLREYGFNWRKEGNQWRLIDTHNQVVSLETALTTIRSGGIEKPKPVFSYVNREAAITWAYSLTHRNQSQRKVVVLDTESNGLDENATIIQLGILDLSGYIIADTLINLDGAELNEKAQAVHGISGEDLAMAPMFTAVWPQLREILATCDVIAYNASFDMRLLAQTAKKYALEMPPLRSHCLMMQYDMYHGELSSPPLRPLEYKMQSLANACAHFGIVNSGAHRALDDAIATKDVLLAMAALYQE